LLLILLESSQAQQIADTTFNPPIAKPAYSAAGGIASTTENLALREAWKNPCFFVIILL